MTGMSFQVEHGNLSRDGIESLDQAFYVASCFAGNSPENKVAILIRVVGLDEEYCVADCPVGPLSDGWTVSYEVSRPRG